MPADDASVPIPCIMFLDRNTMGPAVRVTRPRFAHEWIEYGATASDQVAERLAPAVIAITNKTPIRVAILPTCPSYDVIDVGAFHERSVVVSNVCGETHRQEP